MRTVWMAFALVTYPPLKDFTWIIQLGGYTVGMVVPTASEFKTFKDVIAFAKSNPGKLTYTTPGPSTLNSIAMELVARKEGTSLAHVPGKGGGEAAAAILGGHVMVSVDSRPGRRWSHRAICACLYSSTTSGARSGPTCQRLPSTATSGTSTRHSASQVQGNGPGSGQEAARRLQEGLR